MPLPEEGGDPETDCLPTGALGRGGNREGCGGQAVGLLASQSVQIPSHIRARRL